jgi:hypothetical protein
MEKIKEGHKGQDVVIGAEEVIMGETEVTLEEATLVDEATLDRVEVEGGAEAQDLAENQKTRPTMRPNNTPSQAED